MLRRFIKLRPGYTTKDISKRQRTRIPRAICPNSVLVLSRLSLTISKLYSSEIMLLKNKKKKKSKNTRFLYSSQLIGSVLVLFIIDCLVTSNSFLNRSGEWEQKMFRSRSHTCYTPMMLLVFEVNSPIFWHPLFRVFFLVLK